jgi:hypothetical protein
VPLPHRPTQDQVNDQLCPQRCGCGWFVCALNRVLKVILFDLI